MGLSKQNKTKQNVPTSRASKIFSSSDFPGILSVFHIASISNLCKLYTKLSLARPLVLSLKTGVMSLAAVVLLHEQCAGRGSHTELLSAAAAVWSAVACLCFMHL